MSDERPRIAVLLGPGATAANTAPLVTSDTVRAEGQQFPGGPRAFDALRPQRLAGPVTVYVEQFSAHPLERDAAELYAPPHGYLGTDGTFTPFEPGAAAPRDATPVYRVDLRPDDGLYPLPYVARQANGDPWDFDGTSRTANAEHSRQPFFPDPARLVEEVDRFGLGADGRVGALSALARLDCFRSAPGGGHTKGEQTLGIPAEARGRDFFPYRPPHLRRDPTDSALVRLTNDVQEVLRDGRYLGAVWIEASPSIEETLYWLSLLVDTDRPIAGVVAPDWAHGVVGNGGDRNLIDAVRYCCSRAWADESGADEIGPVLVQGGQIFPAREVRKLDSRAGGYAVTGGLGGPVGTTGHGQGPVVVGFRGRRRHTARSELRTTAIPDTVTGVEDAGAHGRAGPVPVRDGLRLREDALPYVEIVKHGRYQQERRGTVLSALERGAREDRLIGIVVEGLVPYGVAGMLAEAEVHEAVLRGVPVVKVGRDAASGFVDRSTVRVGIAGGNLSATKARMLLMACLLRFGAPAPVADPAAPTAAELASTEAHLARFQDVFDTH